MMCDITMQPLFSKMTIFGLGLLYFHYLYKFLLILLLPLASVTIYLTFFLHVSGLAGLIEFIMFIMCGVLLSMMYAGRYLDLLE